MLPVIPAMMAVKRHSPRSPRKKFGNGLRMSQTLASVLKTWGFLWRHPIASRNRPAALARWLRWQVGARILNGQAVVPFVQGSRLLVRRGMTGATGNIYTGLHEFEEMAFTLHLLRPGELFVDVGANVGVYTVLAA